MEDTVTDLRSLTYSLADEEAAKKEAIAQAMRRAIDRASIALEQKGQKLGVLRYMSLDVRQLYGVAMLEYMGGAGKTVEVSTGGGGGGLATRQSVAPIPATQPQKIAVNATVQCAFQIQ